MSKLSKEEFLKHREQTMGHYAKAMMASDQLKQVYEQIKELIQKPEVTEEWIEEKAKKMSNIVISFNILGSGTNWMANPLERCKDFIRSLVEEIRK